MMIAALAPAACVDSLTSGSPSALRQKVCDPGEIRCTADGNALICRLDGTAFDTSACPVGQRCVSTTCGGAHTWTPGCYDILCDPTDKRCDPTDNVRIETCDPTGVDWCCVNSCGTPEIDGVCYKGTCVSVCNSSAKSYIGCEYFAVDLDNAYVPCGRDASGTLIYCDAAAQQFAVVVSNPDPQNEVVYLVTNGPPDPATSVDACAAPTHVVAAGTLPPKGIEILNLPRRDANGTVKAQLAYRVASNAPMTAYQFNPLDNVGVFSNDATVLLPTNAVGKKYYVMTREQTFDDLKGYVTIVGTTTTPATVTVTVTAKTLAGPGIPALAPGGSFTTSLARYEVLNIETNWVGADLTGSFVSADQPVVVFGGSEAADAPNTDHCDTVTGTCVADPQTPCVCDPSEGPLCNPQTKCSQFITCCADHLEMQLFPLNTWGREYVAVRSKRRGLEKDLWRILASENATHVELTPPTAVVPMLEQGQWFEFESDDDFLIRADHPILVGQFLEAEQAPTPGEQPGDAGTGDPSFILAVPTRQLRDSYVFLAPNEYTVDYVSIASVAGSSVRLDGVDIETLDPDARQVDVRDIAGTPWKATRVLIADGFHILTCPDKCSVMVHGYDQYVSYGYPGGLNLETTTP
ncbi:MAG: IgGFc-binding protein [Deltaproteobacteria bacterium]|nr:IgGFc-binding protein [Deltaproteobacteria bacterium]